MRTFLHIAASLIVVLAANLVTQGASNDWPQWRGPHRDSLSTETGLLKEWPPGGPKLLWKAKGLGSGYSSVSVAGPRIFTLGDKRQHCFVIALNLADGKPLWETELGKPGAPG